jgi:hypothetical protein
MTDFKYDRCEMFVSFANADAARMFAEAIAARRHSQTEVAASALADVSADLNGPPQN